MSPCNSADLQSILNKYLKGRLRFVFVAFERSVRICILQQSHSPGPPLHLMEFSMESDKVGMCGPEVSFDHNWCQVLAEAWL